MNKGKKWEILHETSRGKKKDTTVTIESIVKILLENRGLTNKKHIEDFLNPQLSAITPDTVGINAKQLQKALERIQKAIETKENIVVFGDYDVDGITGTAILWESLYALGAKVIPYIPHRVDEGYGLSITGIENVIRTASESEKPNLIITVDNGIVANEAVDFANAHGIDVIITDHHTLGKELPKALAIVHTTQLCGAGVAYMLSQEISPSPTSDHLALVALATVADLVPLQGANRTLLIAGLKLLRQTKRPGILALCDEAQISPEMIDVYTIGHVIGPRLNAMGRMESAMDSLRLLCTKDRLKAKVYADKLGSTNKERQVLTQTLSDHAKGLVRDGEAVRNILIIANDSYEEGIIGLIAGKLVEEFYRPAIVIAKGEKISKASARSVSGFNIIEFIRSASHLLINAGGHPMAAGFTIETEKIQMLQEYLEATAQEQITDGLLQKVLKIDCEIPLEMVSFGLYESVQTLAPFGMGNFEPVFTSRVLVKEVKTVGQEGRHLKLVVEPIVISISPFTRNDSYSAIAFTMGELKSKLKPGDTINIAYTIDENIWNGKKQLQLKIKDIKIPQK